MKTKNTTERENAVKANLTPIELLFLEAIRDNDKKEEIIKLLFYANGNSYTLTELENIIGVTHRTLLEYIKTGKLQGRKIAGKWRVSAENTRRFLNNLPQLPD